MRRNIFALLLVGVIAAAGLYWYQHSRAVVATAESTLQHEISQTFIGEFSFGKLEITGMNSVTLSDVKIAAQGGNRIAEVKAMTVSFSLLQLVRGKAPVEAITAVSLQDSELTLSQAPNGKWNYEDLFKQKEAAGAEFQGKVDLIRAAVTVETPQGKWQLKKLSGTLDFVHTPYLDIDLAARYGETGLQAHGKIKNNGLGVLTLKADRLALAELVSYLPVDNQITSVGGNISSLEVTVQRRPDQLVYAGELLLTDGAADIRGIAVQGAAGIFTFNEKNLYLLGGRAKIAGQPVEGRGRVTINTSEPVFDLYVKSPGFDPAALQTGLPLAGAIAFDAHVAGTVSNPLLTGDFTLAQGTVNGIAVRAAKAKLKLSGPDLTLDQFEATLLDGRITAGGEINLATQKYRLQAAGSGLAAGQASILPDMDGRIDFNVTMAGKGTETLGDELQGTATIQQGSWRGVAFNKAAVGLRKHGGHIAFDYVDARIGEGTVSGYGSIDDGTLALSLWGNNLEMSAFKPLLPGVEMEGAVSFAGQVGGSLEKPQASAQFRTGGGQILSQPFQEAMGTLRIDEGRLVFDQVRLINGPAAYDVNGSLLVTGGRDISLSVATKSVRAENVIKLLAPGEKLTGNIDSRTMITGTIDNMELSGSFKLSEGSFRGYLIAQAEGEYRQKDGITYIKNVAVNSNNALLTLQGTVDANRLMNITLSAQDIDFSRLHISYPYPVIGTADFNGELRGTPEHPMFHGELVAASLKLNGQQLEKLQGMVNLDGDEVEVPEFGFKQGGGSYAFSGGGNLSEGSIYGNVAVENGEVKPLLKILNAPFREVAGKLNGRILLRGAARQPNIQLTGSLTGGSIKNYPLDKIDIDVDFTDNKLTFNKFIAQQGTGVLAARGTADLNGPVELEVGGRDIDAGLLTAWFDNPFDTVGKLTFTAQMTGASQNPYTAVSLEIKNGGVGSATFDNLFGLFILDKNNIHVDQLLLSKGQYRASAYGDVPLAALLPESRKSTNGTGQMNIKLRLDQADLSILPLLTKEVAWASGPTQGEVNIGGTLAQPVLDGRILIKDGAVKLKSFADPIQKVGVDIQFEGDKINVKSFDGSMGGGTYRLAGTAALKGMALDDYQFSLVLDKLGVNHKYFKGPLSGTLSLAPNGTLPKLSGKVSFENDTINIPYVPELEPSGIQAALNLEVIFGNRVRFYNPYMYDVLASGRVKFDGTTTQPEAAGRIEAVRGTVSYLRTKFKLRDGVVEFNQFGSFEPSIHLNADTRLEQTTVNLKIDGPVSGMNVKLTSEPAMGQQQILSLLTLRGRYLDKQTKDANRLDSGLSRDEIVGLLDVGLQMSFVAELESTFRDAFGLDEFNLVSGSRSDTDQPKNKAGTNQESGSDTVSGREVYNIEVSKYINDRLMVSYTFGVDHNEQSASVRYDLTKKFSLTAGVDRYNRARFGIETRFHF